MPPATERSDDCGRLLRAHRLQEGLSQERLARLATLSPRTIRQIESGRSKPRPGTLKLLAETLKLSEAEWSHLLTVTSKEDDEPEPEPTSGVPRQLPCAPKHFTGRKRELDELDAAVHGDPLWIITGPGGAGKTWLALRWAHDNAERFPDGQLYLDLGGFEADAEPLSTGEALRQLLYALNVEPSAIPRDPGDRASLYRSLLARRRILVLLDNARDEQQVTALLPGGSDCTTLITSRGDLMGLAATHAARHTRPGYFDDAESLHALRTRLGESRVNAEAEAAGTLARLSGGVPLAIGILAARAATHPRFPLSVLATELRNEADRLDALDTGGLTANLRSVFAGSLRQLSSPAVRALCLLGSVPASGVAGHSAASLLGEELPHARITLRELEAAKLVEQYVPGRYRLHDLVRLYAVEEAKARLTATERTAGMRRFVDHYVHTADSADRHISLWRKRLDIKAVAPGVVTAPTPDRAAALWWFGTEMANVLTAQRIAREHGWHDRVWELAWTTKLAQHWLSLHDSEIQFWTAAAEAAEHLDSPVAQVQSNLFLGQAFVHSRRFDEAMHHLHRAREAAERYDDPPNRVGCESVLSICHQFQGDLDRALTHALNASEIAAEHEVSTKLRAESLNLLGWTRALRGDYDQARVDCERAVTLLRDVVDANTLGDTWDSLGYIAQHQDRYDDAREHYARALELYEAAKGGRPWDSAQVYERLGDVHQAMGEPATAVREWQRARDALLLSHHVKDADALAAKIAEFDPAAAKS